MRTFKTSPFGDILDLDNPQTYEYLPKTIKELDNLMFKEIGMALCYMDYFHLNYFPKEIPYDDQSNNSYHLSGYKQRQRVNLWIEMFCTDRNLHYEETNENILWFQETIFLFRDETENMC